MKNAAFALLLLLLAWLFIFNGREALVSTLSPAPAPSPTPGAGIDLSSRLINYTDATYNFTIRYPDVWFAQRLGEPGAYMRFTGASDANGYAENANLAISADEEITNETVADAVRTLQAAFGDALSIEQITQRNDTRIISAKLDLDGDVFYIDEGIIRCPGSVYILTGAVPAMLAPEREAVRYMIKTFEC
jgi:hypothetical protein